MAPKDGFSSERPRERDLIRSGELKIRFEGRAPSCSNFVVLFAPFDRRYLFHMGKYPESVSRNFRALIILYDFRHIEMYRLIPVAARSAEKAICKVKYIFSLARSREIDGSGWRPRNPRAASANDL